MRLLALAVCASALTPPAAAQNPATIATPLADVLQALAEHSAWAQDSTFEGATPDKSRRGVYPVGNGRVFGYLGLGERANTLQAMTGPSYVTAEAVAPKGHFGEHTLTLVRDGAVVDLPRQHLRRVRSANFVVSADEAEGVSLRTLTFAPPDGTDLVRVIEVQNTGQAPLVGLQLVLTAEGAAVAALDPSQSLRRAYAGEGVACYADFTLSQARAAGGKLTEDLGDLAPGATVRTVLTVATHPGTPPQENLRLQPGGRAADLTRAKQQAEATLAWWRTRLADTLYFDSDHAKLRDIVQDWKVLMLVQRDAASGLVLPMVNDRRYSVRDGTGALLAFLRLNLWSDARALLKYTFDSVRLRGRLDDEIPLGLDFAALADKQVDWDAVAVPSSETPSWLVLQHFWYWRVTRDTALVKEHRPLLQRCLVGQKRIDEVLLAFQDQGRGVTGPIDAFYPDPLGADAALIADAPAAGRSAFSFSAAVQMLLATQAMGDLDNGIDQLDNPARWAGEDPKDKPGQRYLTRSFALMQGIESKFWVPEQQFFAPAVSPVTREMHRVPFANANLMPLWLGWTFPTGEKSRDNLRSTLQRLWRSGGRFGATPGTGYAAGYTQGQALVALAERDGRERHDAFDALLAMAEPAGEWGAMYDPQGRPVATRDRNWPDRLRPWDCGINLDALVFAVSGVRFVTVPNWDQRDIRAELRLPKGASYISMRHVRKDARDLDFYWRETFEPMTDDEKKANEEREKEKQRDPEAVHRRMRFRVDQLSENPKAGYYDVGLNAVGTLFVRWLKSDAPIDEVEYWAEDTGEFATPAVTLRDPVHLDVGAEARVLYLSNRDLAGELAGGDPTIALVDTGLPMSPGELGMALFAADGQRRVDTLYFDWNADGTGAATRKPAGFWASPEWTEAVTRFTAAGGRVVRATFATELAGPGGKVYRSGDDGRVDVDVDGEITLTATFTAETASEAVLRLGSSGPARVQLRGETVVEHDATRRALPDQDSVLVRLEAGANPVSVTLRGTGRISLYLRVSDPRGLPIAGVR